jgi:FG-GAP-like repeat
MQRNHLSTFLLVAAVASCSPSDEIDDLEDPYGNSEAGVSLPGSWNPPPDVRAIGAQWNIPYDGAPLWNGPSSCGGNFFPGTRELGDYLRATFPGSISHYEGYSCRQNTNDARYVSVHGTGRALDVFIPLSGGAADNTKGDIVANWLIVNAQAIGVQYIIWDVSDWSGAHGGDKMGAYNGPNRHIDHIHVELTHAGAARQTPWFSNHGSAGGVQVNRAGDYNGDGKTDIITFTQDATADVHVSLSNGAGFLGASKWHDFFAIAGETPSVGDFNGDGKDDIVTFTRGARADVLVSLSNGASFGPAQLWHDFFAIDGEVPAIGDFNGDGKDDIVTFTRGSRADVIVALSTGTGFAPAKLWSDFFAIGNEVPAVGDFNGDGKDDIATFTRGAAGEVHVALSTGNGFLGASKWTQFFALNAEQPVVADFNGDGKDDIATFTRGASGDVFVALSTGAGFLGASKWHDFFAIGSELPGAGDFTGDGKADIVTFTRGAAGKVFVAPSTGAAFGASGIWNPFFAINNETPHPSANAN